MLTIAAVLFLPPVFSQEQKVLFEKESQYHYIIVDEVDGLRTMHFRRKGREYDESKVNKNDPYTPVLNYTRLFFSSFFFCPKAKKVLMIGLGGGSVPRIIHKFFPQVQIDTVELDPAVVEAAKKHFFYVTDDRSRAIVRDGRVQVRIFLKKNVKYDIVMLDAFRGGYIPYHLTTKEFMEQCKGLLTERGIVAANMRPDFMIYDYHKRTIASVFPSLFTFGKKGNKICVALPRKKDYSESQLRRVAMSLQSKYSPSFRLPELLNEFDPKIDYETRGEIFTDDYAPVNVLRGIPRE